MIINYDDMYFELDGVNQADTDQPLDFEKVYLVAEYDREKRVEFSRDIFLEWFDDPETGIEDQATKLWMEDIC